MKESVGGIAFCGSGDSCSRLSRGSASGPLLRGWRVLAEIAVIFLVFFIQGAWPVPDVNEPHYLGKTIHYWNPSWAAGDFFLDSKDTHKVFYFTFGWLSLWLTPVALAWTGRIITWWLLAWSWRRLSFAVLPRRGWSIVTAALFAMLMERAHMAGEWVIGGVEAKGFAYVLVFLGLEALVRNRWNRAWLWLGAASAFHVIVGGWATVAAGLAWIFSPRDRPRPAAMLPALVLGFILSLPGLLPSLLLNLHVDAATIGRANQIYVFKRLPHHLDLFHIQPGFIVRFLILTLLFFALSWRALLAGGNGAAGGSEKSAVRRLAAFVVGAIAIALAGAAINMLKFVNADLAAALLRYYWFRLADVAVPLGVSVLGCVWIAEAWKTRADASSLRRTVPIFPLLAAILAGAAVICHFGTLAAERIAPGAPRADRLPDFAAWHEACLWAADERNAPAGARFITPRMAQTFKWYSGRAEVATWKDVPQDAPEIVEWWTRMEELFADRAEPGLHLHEYVNDLTTRQIEGLGKKYQADFVITPTGAAPLDLKIVYQNEGYTIYKVEKP
jgi:hypothetical protein